MAGGAPLSNGPIQPPDVRVEQIFRLTEPIPVEAGLPTAVVGVNRHVEFEENLGNFTGGSGDVTLAITSLQAFAGAAIIDIAPISWINSVTGVSATTQSLPQVFLRHDVYGDLAILPAAPNGYTIDSANGTLEVDGGLTMEVTAVTSNSGAYTAWGTPNFGRRTFTDLGADFIATGIATGDTIVIGGIDIFTVDSTVNSTQLVVTDSAVTNVQTTTSVASGVNYTIRKMITGSTLIGSVFITYAANRTDRVDQLQTVTQDTLTNLLGNAGVLNPLAQGVQAALNSAAGTSVIALQIDQDNIAGHTEAMEILSNSEVPYNIVPLTQDTAVLALYQAHVVNESDPDVRHERRLWQSQLVPVETCKVDNDDSSSQPLVTPTSTEVTFTVLGGGNNIHTSGVAQGDVLKDLTPGFGGEGRIISISSPATNDDPVSVTLASPNTLGLVGGQAEMTLDPGTGAQLAGFRIDDVSSAAAGQTLTIMNTVFTQGTEWTNTATLVDAINTAFEGALLATDQGSDEIRVNTLTGGWTDAMLLTEGYTVATTISGATLESITGSSTVTQFVIEDQIVGLRGGETFSIRDQRGTVVTFEFDRQSILDNGAVGDGSSVTLSAIAVLIGGTQTSSTDVRDQILAAVAAGNHNGRFTAAADDVTPLIRITARDTGPVGASAATGSITTTVGGQEGGAQIDVTGALATETVTIAGTVFVNTAIPSASTEWSNAATLAQAINANVPNVQATDAGTVVSVRTTTYGWTNALLSTLSVADTVTGANWARIGAATLAPLGQFNIEGATVGVMDGEAFTLNDGILPAQTFEFDRTGTVGAGNIAVDLSLAATATGLSQAIESAIGSSTLSITATATGGTTTLVHGTAGLVGNQTITETVSDAGFSVTGMTGGANGTLIGPDTITTPAFVTTSVSAGTGAVNGSPLTTWQICTNPFTVDQHANAIARAPMAINQQRVSNVWPSSADIIFSDQSAGQIGDLEQRGIFNGAQVVVQRQPGFYITCALAGRRSGLLSSLPLTGRNLPGIYQLRDVRDRFSRTQLLRIGSTGNVLMEQPGGIGTTISAVRSVTTNVTDLTLAEENVNAQVDDFARNVRITGRSIFGPNVIDPEGQFIDLFSVRIQSVINEFTDSTRRRAESIKFIRTFVDPDNKDTVIAELDYTPLFGANQGIIRIFI